MVRMHMKSNINTTNKGAAMIFFILLFVMATSALLFVYARNLYIDAYTVGSLASSKQAHFVGESALEDVVYRMITRGDSIDNTQLDMLLGRATTTVTYDSVNDLYIVQARSLTGESRRVTTVELSRAPGNSFNYGMHTGNGGFRIRNGSRIIGNVFANGPIEGQGGAYVTGDAISSGPDGLIDEMDIWGDSWSQTLRDSEVQGHAHYNVLEGSNDLNESTTPFTVMDPEPLPISDDELDEWQAQIEATGTLISASDPRCAGGTFDFSDASLDLGNVKIECNLTIRGGGSGGTELTLTGSVWVVGDVVFREGPHIRVANSQGSNSTFIIADDPDDRMNSGTFDIRNDTTFAGSGHPNSFIMLVARNHAASNGGSTDAISVGQSSEGRLILYSNNGNVSMGNRTELNSITAYRIDANNNSEVSYEDGLQNINFSGGPGGTYRVTAWYQE